MGTISTAGNILSSSSGSNGPDVNAMVTQAMTAASAPIKLLQQQQTTLNNQAAALQSIQTDLTSLMTTVNALDDAKGQFNSVSASSSNSNVLTATADTTAAAQAHSIVVSSVATTSSYYTNPVTTSITTGSFQIAVGSNTPVTVTASAGSFQFAIGSNPPVTVTADNTVSSLAAAINSQSLGVTASVVNDASGARLSVVSSTTGAPGDLTISSNTTGLTFNKAVTGSNASLTVDGVPVSSASNTVSGVIQGVTLSLAGAAPSSTISLSIAPDTSKATDAINQFVSSYNKVVKDINTQFTVLADGSGAGPLETDSTLRLIQQQLLTAVNYSIGGNNGYVNLASIGVNTNNDGTLSVDSSALSKALSSNFSSVQNFMQGTALSGFANSLWSTVNQITDPTQGTITMDLQGVTQSNQSLTQQISDMQVNLQFKQQSLIDQFTQVEVTLQELPQLQSQITQQLGSLK
jgi:flagellar hook-associated protein 2